jgi:chaperonin GroEL
MIYSKAVFNEKARRLLIDGAREVYKAVSTTLGARGRNVVIHAQHHTKVIHDGVKTAQEINPKNPFKNAGAQILKQAAQRQVDTVGDGTTVAVILGYAIAKETLKIIESGINPMGLKNALVRGVDKIVDKLKKLSTPIKNVEEKIQIATISSEDKELGKMIGETYHKAGVDAVITAEQITGSDTFIDHQEGMQINSGYKSEWFITNPKSMTATVTKAKILVTDYKLDNIHDLLPLINNMIEKSERNLVVIAEDIEGSMLASLITNKMKGSLNCLVLKAPSYDRDNVLQDIAVTIGANFISKESTTPEKFKELKIEDLGYADRVTSTKDATVIVEGGGNKKEITERIKSIKNQIKEEDNEFKKEKLKERLAKLTGGVYVIKVGGATEIEAEEKYERADDAIKATASAIEEGIIPGGEIAFLGIMNNVQSENEEEEYAYRILKRALERPFKKLVENAGYNSGVMMTKVNPEKAIGIDVTTGEVVNMYEEGIIDPTKVATEAIRNAISVANAIITSDGIISILNDKEEK